MQLMLLKSVSLGNMKEETRGKSLLRIGRSNMIHAAQATPARIFSYSLLCWLDALAYNPKILVVCTVVFKKGQ